jgi:hypothetical protein
MVSTMNEDITTIEEDSLALVIKVVREQLSGESRIGTRIQILWAGVVVSRDIASADVIRQQFTRIARETDIVRDLGPHGEEDLAHVIRWGLLDRNPFGLVKS